MEEREEGSGGSEAGERVPGVGFPADSAGGVSWGEREEGETNRRGISRVRKVWRPVRIPGRVRNPTMTVGTPRRTG